jgi:hypothetical protein
MIWFTQSACPFPQTSGGYMAREIGYKIRRGFVWYSNEGGDGIRRNTGEPLPEGILSNPKIIQRLLEERAIEQIDANTGEKIASKYDYAIIADSDIKALALNSGWQNLVNKIGTTDYSPECLQKLKGAISQNVRYVNKEAVVQAIDSKLEMYTQTRVSMEEPVQEVKEQIEEVKVKRIYRKRKVRKVKHEEKTVVSQ